MSIQTAVFTAWTGADAWEHSFDRNRMNFWILSTHLAAKHFRKVVLHTDDLGKTMLHDYLKLPFTEVTTIMNGVPKRLSFLYSIGKSYSYREQAALAEPFLHLDDDFLIWEDTRLNALRNAPAVTQHWYPIQKVLADFCRERWAGDPTLTVPARSVCSGALGGNDTRRLLDFAQKSIDMANDHRHEPAMRSAIKTPQPWLGPCMLEEALFAHYFPDGGSFLPHRFDPTEADWIASGCSHSIGGIKRNPMVQLRHDRYARAYPDAYQRANALHSEIVKTVNP